MDEQGADTYGAITMTPYYYGKDTFDVAWLGYWTSQKAMGAGIDNYLANGGKSAKAFAEVLTCDAHGHFASIQVKEPPESQPGNQRDNG